MFTGHICTWARIVMNWIWLFLVPTYLPRTEACCEVWRFPSKQVCPSLQPPHGPSTFLFRSGTSVLSLQDSWGSLIFDTAAGAQWESASVPPQEYYSLLPSQKPSRGSAPSFGPIKKREGNSFRPLIRYCQDLAETLSAPTSSRACHLHSFFGWCLSLGPSE